MTGQSTVYLKTEYGIGRRREDGVLLSEVKDKGGYKGLCPLFLIQIKVLTGDMEGISIR